MKTRYRYLGRPWTGLPARDIEPDEVEALAAPLEAAVRLGAYVAELVPEPEELTQPEELAQPEAAPEPPSEPAPKPKPRSRRRR